MTSRRHTMQKRVLLVWGEAALRSDWLLRRRARRDPPWPASFTLLLLPKHCRRLSCQQAATGMSLKVMDERLMSHPNPTHTLHLKSVTVSEIEWSFTESLSNTLTDPNLESSQGVTTHYIRCTKPLDIRRISGWYPWYPAVGFGPIMAVFSDFSRFFYFDHCLLLANI